METPEPTEAITGWIPHHARRHAPARAGLDPLRRYVTGLVTERRDGGTELTDEGGLRSIRAVVDGLGALGASGVDRHRVRDALLLPHGLRERA